MKSNDNEYLRIQLLEPDIKQTPVSSEVATRNYVPVSTAAPATVNNLFASSLQDLCTTKRSRHVRQCPIGAFPFQNSLSILATGTTNPIGSAWCQLIISKYVKSAVLRDKPWCWPHPSLRTALCSLDLCLQPPLCDFQPAIFIRITWRVCTCWS